MPHLGRNIYMPGKNKISSRQELLLMLNFLLASAFIIIPSSAVAGARQDGWLALILATITGIGIAILYTAAGLRFPGQTIVQCAQSILGKIPGKLVGLGGSRTHVRKNGHKGFSECSRCFGFAIRAPADRLSSGYLRKFPFTPPENKLCPVPRALPSWRSPRRS